MWSNPQENVDLVAFTAEIFNEKLHFLCSDIFDCRPNEISIAKVDTQMFLKSEAKDKDTFCL